MDFEGQAGRGGRRWARRVALAFGLAALIAPLSSAAMTRAVFVGIDTYANSHPRTPGFTPQVHDLEDSVTDVAIVKKAITARYDIALDPGPDATSPECAWRTATSVTLVNACATRSAVLAALNDQVSQANAGDAILFFFSGIGSTLTAPGSAEPVGSLVPVDGRDPAGAVPDISMREVEALENRARARGAKLYSVLDACQPAPSGSWGDDARAAPYRAGAPVPSERSSRTPGEPTRVAAACFGGNFDGDSGGVAMDAFVSLEVDDISAGGPRWLHGASRSATPLPAPGTLCTGQLMRRGDPHPTQQQTTFRYAGRCRGVVRGVPAKPGEAPWMAELQYAPPFRPGFHPAPTVTHNCGAALIRQDWIVTAAHCLADAANVVDPREVPRIRVVRMGSLDLNGSMLTYRITRAVVHPGYCNSAYDRTTGREDLLDPDPCPMTTNDIALLHIAPDPSVGISARTQPGPLPNLVLPKPITLAALGSEEPDSEPVQVVGWGASSAANSRANAMEPKLQIGKLKIVNPNDCATRIGAALRRLDNAPDATTSYDDGLPPSVLCAGVDDDSIDSCQGDSGGPLVTINRYGDARLIGVVSEGPSCAAAPGIYTKVSFFRGWINQVLAQEALSP